MTTKKPKAPTSPAKGNKTAKKPASPAKGGKPSLSQQKRLKALRGTQVALPAPVPRTEAPKSLPAPPKGFRELRDEHERALEKRIPYPDSLDGWDDVTLQPAPPLPAAQKRDKKLLYAAIGVVALGAGVYYGGWL